MSLTFEWRTNLVELLSQSNKINNDIDYYLGDIFYPHSKEFPPPHIFSLAEVPDSLPHWRWYGNDGRGVCIEFDVKALKEHILCDSDLALAKVIYDDNDYKELATFFLSHCTSTNKDHELFCPFEFDLPLLISILKHNCFKEESEWRLVCSRTFLNDEKGCIKKYIGNDGVVKSAYEMPLPEKGVITKLYFGPQLSERDLFHFCDVIEDKLGFTGGMEIVQIPYKNQFNYKTKFDELREHTHYKQQLTKGLK